MIVCEIGQNHCGDMDLAKWLIKMAKYSGGDLAKFQLYDSQKLYGEYQPTELTREQATELFEYGKTEDIEVFFSVFDVERVGWCEEMGVKRYKLACYWGRKAKLVATIDKTRKPVIISENREIPGRIIPKTKVSWLYCVRQYPTPLDELHLRTVCYEEYDDDFDGFSDHTIGLDTAKIAIARGAKIIEKHFAVDHHIGVDAPWSMTPEELKELRRWYDLVQTVL